MIVFGWNSFKIGVCKPSKLGMSEEYDKEIIFERRQKYFHLFWIPFFGIGKIWVLRKRGDSNLYEPSIELRSALESLPEEHKTPWYTFSLFFLIMAGAVFFSLFTTIDEYSRKKRYEASLVQRKIELTESIKNPHPGTFYKMDAGGKTSFLKVLGTDGESLVCLYRKKLNNSYSEFEILEAFVTDSINKSFDTVKIPKAEMLKTINGTESYGFKGHEVIKDAGRFVLEELKVISFPVFKTLGMGYQDGEFFAVVQNIGANGKFKEYIAQKTNLELSTPLFPEELKNGESILLKGSYHEAQPFTIGKLKIESSANIEALYDFQIDGRYVYFRQLQK